MAILRRIILILAGASALTLARATPTWANGQHGHEAGIPGTSVLLGFLIFLLAVVVLACSLGLYIRWRPSSAAGRQLRALASSDYISTVRGFSRNAKLLLSRSLIVGVNFGLWHVLFNLYLLAAGFDEGFVAKMVAVNWLIHGLVVIPAGIISDLLGRRRVFLVAYAIAILFRGLRLFTLDPQALLIFSALGGATEGFHAITGPPFMLEQSRPEERVHLFSLSAVCVAVSLTVGNAMAGFFPVWLAGSLGVEVGSATALRAALVIIIPVGIASMVPIYLIKEEWHVVSLKAWFTGLTSQGIMARLTLTQGLEAVGLGLVVTFFNVMFVSKYGASTMFVGNLFAISTVVVAGFTLFTPLLVKRLGQVRTLVGIQFTGLPFLMLMVVAPNWWFSGAGYMLRETFTGIGAGPTGGMGSPIERLFPMEIVKQHERGTTNGLMHAFLEFPMSIGAWIAGPMMVRGEWSLIYLLAGAWFAASYLTFLYFFQPVEARMRAAAPAGGGLLPRQGRGRPR